MRRVPWLALGALLAGLGAWASTWLRPVADLLPGCAFKHFTGLACMTCGLTRCVMALGQGDWRGAFHWHPAAAGLAFLLPLLSLWDLRRARRGDPYPRLPDSRKARTFIWVLLLAVWAFQVVRGI
ncbi:hypothetical protein GETHLI_15670 [Geothrix limicola]|uniref:DUF2752 domain-containing protein n=1 Tax=Geothrix limicola TaxID=2927978 RepID=A0ABQ5QF54_9BACT|nr:DUF2752 domain-containing protein [Geothrix limicola]GLH73065.1 hypothetical protein GETHLI_15670 [Geothrix limicola]